MKHLKHVDIRLAATYLAIIMVMSVGFSIVFYNASLRELGRPPRAVEGRFMLSPDDTSLRSYLDQHADQARDALLLDLAFVNLLALIVGGLLSYLLAERTLRPIEDNMEAQAQFVSDASHELRTPLTALRTANEVAMRDKHLTLAGAKRVIADNVDDITRLQDLANSMLGLLKEDDASMMQHAVPLQAVVGDAMMLVVNQAQAKDIAVDDTTTNVMVRGNHHRLVQLVTILLDNAIKYSDAGTTVYVASERRGRMVVLTVRDEGVGMDKETIENMFTRFYRAEKSRTSEGYGLGLSIAKKIVDAHGGRITVQSQPGEGATFTVTLPVATDRNS